MSQLLNRTLQNQVIPVKSAFTRLSMFLCYDQAQVPSEEKILFLK